MPKTAGVLRNATFGTVDPVRSRIMRANKSTNTGPEVLVRSFLHRQGLRFRLKAKDLPCRPDLVLPASRVAIFVHGCFWHFHSACKAGRIPATNRSYWRPKLTRNRSRDARNVMALNDRGWHTVTIWACQLGPAQLRCLAGLLKRLARRTSRPSRGEHFSGFGKLG